MAKQFLLKSNNTSYPPNTLRKEDLMGSSGKCDNLLKAVYDNVLVVFEGNRHDSVDNQGAGLPLHKANRF
jgi:tRNA pseudouridine-54 N-methylase